ncbi:MAG: hypothetical protein AAF433_22270 [Bacteroidota bacterium]
MQVTNIHSRDLPVSKEELRPLLLTLASPEDQVWPHECWPPMRFKAGLEVGARGGHGPIRYTIEEYEPGSYIKVRFSRPAGFQGHHWLEVVEGGDAHCQIRHTIQMRTNFVGSMQWLLAIKWLHNALIEDAFDKVGNYFSSKQKRTPWNFWVRSLRLLLS